MDQELIHFNLTGDHMACLAVGAVLVLSTIALTAILVIQREFKEHRRIILWLFVISLYAYGLRLVVIPPWIYSPAGDEERMIFGPFLMQWDVASLPLSSGIAADVWAWAMGVLVRLFGITPGPRTLPWINQVATLPLIFLVGLACIVTTGRGYMAAICAAFAAIFPQVMFWSTSAYDLAPAIPALAAWMLAVAVLLKAQLKKSEIIAAAIVLAGSSVWLTLCRVELWIAALGAPALLIIASARYSAARRYLIPSAALTFCALAAAALLIGSATESRTGVKIFGIDYLFINLNASRFMNAPAGGIIPLILTVLGLVAIRYDSVTQGRSTIFGLTVIGLLLMFFCLSYDGYASKYAVWNVILLSPICAMALAWPTQRALNKGAAAAATLAIVSLAALPPFLRWGFDIRTTDASFTEWINLHEAPEISQAELLGLVDGHRVFASPGLHDPLRRQGLIDDTLLDEAMHLVGPRRLQANVLAGFGEKETAYRLIAPYDHTLTAIGWWDRMFRERAMFELVPVARCELADQPVLLCSIETRPWTLLILHNLNLYIAIE